MACALRPFKGVVLLAMIQSLPLGIQAAMRLYRMEATFGLSTTTPNRSRPEPIPCSRTVYFMQDLNIVDTEHRASAPFSSLPDTARLAC